MRSSWVRLAFYRQIFDMMTAETKGILIGGVDLNVRINPEIDSTGTNLTHSKPIGRKIRTLMSEIGLINVWREINPTFRHIQGSTIC